jgi:hypothetical protein
LRQILKSLLLSFCVGAVMALACSQGARADGDGFSEQAIKAAYLHRFAAYVEWPPDALPEGTFTIGVFGSDAVVAELQQLLPTLIIHGRAARVRSITRAVDARDVSILYIGHGRLAAARDVILAARDQPVLVVTDDSGGLRVGAAINFVQVDRHVRFEVSQLAADRRGLKVDAALLAVAARVEER